MYPQVSCKVKFSSTASSRTPPLTHTREREREREEREKRERGGECVSNRDRDRDRQTLTCNAMQCNAYCKVK